MGFNGASFYSASSKSALTLALSVEKKAYSGEGIVFQPPISPSYCKSLAITHTSFIFQVLGGGPRLFLFWAFLFDALLLVCFVATVSLANRSRS